MAKVSVIVPNYNHEKFLAQRMESILQQTYRDFEVILLDDCSSDGSREILESYRGHEKVRSVVYNEENSGSAFSQWKKGISFAEGKYIWIAESDDYCDLNFLEIAVKEMENGAGLFYCDSISVDEKGEPRTGISKWTDDLSKTRWLNNFENDGKKEAEELLVFKNSIPNASAVVFLKTGNVSPLLEKVVGMKFCGDWLFWMMYLTETKKMTYSVETKNYFRFHGKTSRTSADHFTRDKEVMKVLKFALQHKSPAISRKTLVNYFSGNHFSQQLSFLQRISFFF